MIKKEENKTFDHYYALGLKYLTGAIKSEFEVRKYLKRRKTPLKYIEGIIEKLKGYKYIDDEEYSRIFAENKMRASQSSFAVQYGLKQKGISGQVSDRIVEKVFENVDEREVARNIAMMKAGKMTECETSKKLSRISSFLRRKGYPQEAIYYALEPIINQVNEEN